MSRLNLQTYVRDGLPLSRVVELKAIFDLFDSHGQGSIEVKELERSLLDLDLVSSATYQTIAKMQECGDTLTFEEFVNLMAESTKWDFKSFDGCRKLFEALDTDKTGILSVETLMRVAEELGERLGCEEAAEIIKRADFDEDGLVNLDDFYRIMRR